MASTSLLHLSISSSLPSRRRGASPLLRPHPPLLRRSPLRSRAPISAAAGPAEGASPLHALIFDCDGVILESEHLHRQAYNDAFAHFSVRSPASSSEILFWETDFYDELQNRIGGGKPKMRWYFNENGWPSSSVFEDPPVESADKEKLIDILQDWKTERYKEIIKSGVVKPRPGVLRLMDDVKGAGIKLSVCSAATKSSVILCLENLLGLERFQGLDCFLAGDDVKEKKPDPSIYLTASQKLGVLGKNCLVVEDSVIGLQAATGAGMPCIITYTSSTANQDFKDAIATYPDLSNVRLEDLELLLQKTLVAS
ncbi:haloacid dehalogenase-like hydrolase domain-containing protein At4g39970 [Dioscorea cayenensis subsp. rotundata]|uniref:Haloacid dehalogenase-like hydrolase domain-containing protein At4g39970 n=1 Tax=Dioscorea cayennensis subsp. rotundata TaxID=55577 RepID=A0AB40BEG7_DIOCR|nr:haloacid dehalogenase-like hydrolase domain-containing protein At4g39970 [Dioscorea cayenensis subsp. rotundata]